MTGGDEPRTSGVRITVVLRPQAARDRARVEARTRLTTSALANQAIMTMASLFDFETGTMKEITFRDQAAGERMTVLFL